MRLKSIFNITPVTAKSGVCTCSFVFKDFPLSSVFAGKGFSEVADWLRVQESLKWALARGWPLQSFGLVSTGKRNLAHELNGKKINKSKRIKGCKETKWLFFFSWYRAGLWFRAHGWRESSFVRRERNSRARGEVKRELRESDRRGVLGI